MTTTRTQTDAQDGSKSKSWFSWRRLLHFLGLPLFVYILTTLDYTALKQIFLAMETSLLGLGLCGMVVTFFLKGVRASTILSGQGYGLKRKAAMLAYFRSTFWGIISPGRLGELSRVVYLADAERPAGSCGATKAVANVVLDRMFDLAAVLLFLFASALMTATSHQTLALGASAGLLLLGFGGLAAGRYGIRRYGAGRNGYLINFLREVTHLNGLVSICLQTLILWGLYYTCLFTLASALGIEASFSFIVFSSCVANVASILPISVAGIGLRDAVLIFLFANAGLSAEQAVSFSLIFLLVHVLNLVFLSLFLFGGMRRASPHGHA